MNFTKATKMESRLRLALIGPAGTGKTYTALSVAAALVPGGRVAVIDTERGSASKYADAFAFDVCNLERHSPTDYVAAIRSAESAGYDVIVVDSLSHAWTGKGGALELVDQAAKRARTPNSFGAWREVTPLHNEMVDAIVGSRAHVIVTLRAKTEWVQEQDERGKTRIRKVGLAPVQRDGLEYEFDVVGDLDQEHNLLVTKTRCSLLANALVNKPGAEFAATLREWLHGEPVAAPVSVSAPAPARPVAEVQNPNVSNYITVLPKSDGGDPAQPALTIEEVLAKFQEASSEMELLQVGPLARSLPSAHLAVARKAYANRQKELQAREQGVRLVRQAFAKDPQKTVDFFGQHGVVLDSSEAIDGLSDEALEAFTDHHHAQ